MITSPRSEKLDLRLSIESKKILTAAAAVEHRSLSDFVLMSALAHASETLADRQYFGLDAEQWTAFIEALDAAPRDLPRIERLFREPSVFETSEDD